MPLIVADPGSIGPKTLTQVPEKFLIFYSSPVRGELWCPDCRVVESKVRETFDEQDQPSALIVYVGDKPQWKATSNSFRGDPWYLTSIPTIVKLENGKEVGRLVDRDILDKLASFIKE